MHIFEKSPEELEAVNSDALASPDGAVPWYIAGLAFECQECGCCCKGPEEGYVWAKPEELATLAEHLGLEEKAFYEKYVRRIGRRFSLIEDKKTNDCIFVKGGQCQVYSVRPTQCRTWPFWHSNIETPEDWSYAAQRCKGVNRGPLHNARVIRQKADATRE